jgi:hypothetical protein
LWVGSLSTTDSAAAVVVVAAAVVAGAGAEVGEECEAAAAAVAVVSAAARPAADFRVVVGRLPARVAGAGAAVALPAGAAVAQEAASTAGRPSVLRVADARVAHDRGAVSPVEVARLCNPGRGLESVLVSGHRLVPEARDLAPGSCRLAVSEVHAPGLVSPIE